MTGAEGGGLDPTHPSAAGLAGEEAGPAGDLRRNQAQGLATAEGACRAAAPRSCADAEKTKGATTSRTATTRLEGAAAGAAGRRWPNPRLCRFGGLGGSDGEGDDATRARGRPR